MTTTTTTPALDLANKLTALASHLRAHPYLPYVNVTRGPFGEQISGYECEDGSTDAPGVLLWARSLTNPALKLTAHGPREDGVVNISVTADIDGISFTVWDVDGGGLLGLLPERARSTPITLDQLAAYVATGTVEVPS
jgi:hypothetical protein